MVITGFLDHRSLTLSVKPNCLTISLGGAADSAVYSFDYEGRLWTAMQDGVSYRRGLDGKIVAKWQLPANKRSRKWLTEKQARELEKDARDVIKYLYEKLASNPSIIDDSLPDLARHGFEQAIAFDEQRSRFDVARYHQVYQKVGILPPDQYMAVVLQATEGCSFNTCTFCNFYRDRVFRIKQGDDFRAHARLVKEYLGEGLSLRRTIFLGDANALVVPMAKLLPIFEIVHDVFDVNQLGGIYAFLDGFSGERKSSWDYRTLAEYGLKRVYIGMESGSEDLLKFLKKPGNSEDVVRAVQAMKSGSVSVGVIVLLGAGGRQYSRVHIEDTIQAINRMEMDADDLIYFSELIESEGLEYTRDAFQANLRPLSPEERIAQGEEIESRLEFSETGGVPHISRYDIREFVY